MKIKKIREAFEFPLGLVQVDTLEGMPIYSSDKLRQKYLEVFDEEVRDEEIVKKVANLIKQKKIIPCFVTKSFLKRLFTRFNLSSSLRSSQ